jgi:hypothetical protein
MVRVHAQPAGDAKALVDRGELQQLIDVARRIEEVELVELHDDLPADAIMRLLQEGDSLKFRNDPREDVYSVHDLKVRYR